MNPEWDGAALRNHLLVEHQRSCVLAGRPLRSGPYLGALICGTPVQFVAADGRRWVLDEVNAVREWTPEDAGLPGAQR